MNEDNLRILDGLFAEHVLGRVVGTSEIILPGFDDGWWWSHPPGVGHILIEGGKNPLPKYTRSLDAAWAGAATLKKAFGVEYDKGLWAHQDCEANVGDAGSYVMQGGEKSSHHANHPAEALVIACLRAVGCPIPGKGA